MQSVLATSDKRNVENCERRKEKQALQLQLELEARTLRLLQTSHQHAQTRTARRMDKRNGGRLEPQRHSNTTTGAQDVAVRDGGATTEERIRSGEPTTDCVDPALFSVPDVRYGAGWLATQCHDEEVRVAGM